jgi:hypothetical protein
MLSPTNTQRLWLDNDETDMRLSNLSIKMIRSDIKFKLRAYAYNRDAHIKRLQQLLKMNMKLEKQERKLQDVVHESDDLLYEMRYKNSISANDLISQFTDLNTYVTRMIHAIKKHRGTQYDDIQITKIVDSIGALADALDCSSVIGNFTSDLQATIEDLEDRNHRLQENIKDLQTHKENNDRSIEVSFLIFI